MIFNLKQIRNNGGIPQYDVCIIGSGPAGLTVANELSSTRLKICVLESGDLRRSLFADKFREVDYQGIKVKNDSRERVFGGTSSTWAGLSSVLEPTDLEKKDYISYSGWPISYTELSKYYAKASEIYNFPPLSFYDKDGIGAIKKVGRLSFESESIREKVFVAKSEPQRFAKMFIDLFKFDNIDLFINSTALYFEEDGNSERVDKVRIFSSGEQDAYLKARVFVLACGGIDNAKVLLSSTKKSPAGLGNKYDQVGRYLMNHPKGDFGCIKLPKYVMDEPYYFGWLNEGFAGYVGIRLSNEVLKKEKALGSYMRLVPVFPWSGKDGVGVFISYVKKIEHIFALWKKINKQHILSIRDYSETGDESSVGIEMRKGFLSDMLIMIKHSWYICSYLYFRVFSFAIPKIDTIRIRNFLEMAPHPDNRVILGENVDISGQRVPIVRHKLMSTEKRSLKLLHQIFAKEISENKVGTYVLKTGDNIDNVCDDASHYMGTTRIGDSSLDSVVNVDCRVHGIDNLFVVGSSVFPTSGLVNPTYTIVALSIRLADHLKAYFDIK